MQLTLRVNNGIPVKGAVRGKGVLSAIVTVLVRSAGNGASGKAMLHAFEFGSSDTSDWSAGELSVGDKIEIQLLPDSDADEPTKTGRISDNPGLLFADPVKAREALAKMRNCKESLEGILQAAKINEPHEEALNIQRATIAVVQNLGKYLITPTLRRHPELTSDARELDLIDQ